MDILVKPFIKWAGSKRKLSKIIYENLPENFDGYFEPFVGSGAIFFNGVQKNATISDINEDLINCYKVVRDKPLELLDFYKKTHQGVSNLEDHYYSVRNIDRCVDIFQNFTDVERAARFIFLNKNAFNGLHRVNRFGHFNVPFNKRKNEFFIKDEDILNCSDRLKETFIFCGHYKKILDMVKSNDFVYLDPPYYTDSDKFTKYSKDDFKLQDHIDLRLFCDKLNEKGVFFMLSNTDHNFVSELFKHYNILRVNTRYMISCKNRKEVTELLIKNYK